MQKLKIMLIPMCAGMILLFLSWCLSYPVSIDSPYDFVYNHISRLYWLGLPILFASFFIVAIKTKNNTLRWAMTVGTVLLIYSRVYFYYMIPGSDIHMFRGLNEYFISTEDLTLKPYHEYFQWPVFFILNNVASSITGLDLGYLEFILFSVIGFVITSFIYFYASKVRTNAYIAVTAFFIILSYFFNYQWAPYLLSVSLTLVLLFLDSMSGKREATLAMLIIFIATTYTHIFVPIVFIVYSFVMYIINKNRKHLTSFLLTSIIYVIVMSYNLMLPLYTKQLTRFHFLQFLYRIEVTTASSVAPQPYIDVIAQFSSRIVVITTTILTGLGFIILLIRRKLRRTDYAILLTGVIFSAALLVSFKGYQEIWNRAFFLVAIPASLGASYLSESKFKKHFKSIFLILLLLFTFVLIHQTFYDRQIFFQTRTEYQCANFMIDNIDWHTSNDLLSHYRFMHYLHTRSSSENVKFWSDFSEKFPEDIDKCNYVAYTVGLAKSFLRVNYSVEKSFREFELNHFNLIYNSGNFSYVFSHDQGE